MIPAQAASDSRNALRSYEDSAPGSPAIMARSSSSCCVGDIAAKRVRAAATRSGVVVPLGTRTLEEEQIIGREINGIEAQRISRVGQTPHQIRARPINQRHEVVTNDRDTGFGDGGKRIFPGGDVLTVRPGAQLDGGVNRNAFHHRPEQASRFDFSFALEDFVQGPRLATIDVVKRRDDTGSPSLSYLRQRNGILWSKPAPGFLHDFPAIFIG